MLTKTALFGGITIVTSHTMLAAETFSVVQTLEALACAGVTTAWYIRINVIVAYTSHTAAAWGHRVSIVVVNTAVTGWFCTSVIEKRHFHNNKNMTAFMVVSYIPPKPCHD